MVLIIIAAWMHSDIGGPRVCKSTMSIHGWLKRFVGPCVVYILYVCIYPRHIHTRVFPSRWPFFRDGGTFLYTYYYYYYSALLGFLKSAGKMRVSANNNNECIHGSVSDFWCSKTRLNYAAMNAVFVKVDCLSGKFQWQLLYQFIDCSSECVMSSHSVWGYL